MAVLRLLFIGALAILGFMVAGIVWSAFSGIVGAMFPPAGMLMVWLAPVVGILGAGWAAMQVMN